MTRRFMCQLAGAWAVVGLVRSPPTAFLLGSHECVHRDVQHRHHSLHALGVHGSRLSVLQEHGVTPCATLRFLLRATSNDRLKRCESRIGTRQVAKASIPLCLFLFAVGSLSYLNRKSRAAHQEASLDRIANYKAAVIVFTLFMVNLLHPRWVLRFTGSGCPLFR